MKNITRIYVLALGLIGLVLGISQFLIQSSISGNASDSRIINISGRQRMLSQKISKAALALSEASSDMEYTSRKKELENALLTLTESHEGLTKGNEKQGLTIENNNEKVLGLYEKITPYYENINTSAKNLLAYNSIEEFNSSSAARSDVANILASEGDFLVTMNAIVFEYDDIANGKINRLSTTEYVLFSIVIILLLIVALFVFRPAVKKLKETTERVLQLEKAEKEQALSDKQYLTSQAEIIFANVNQGIFLLDQDFIIDSFYSKETEAIFDEESLAKTNFLNLMKPKLMQRDQEALDLFAEHLFNPEIREDVVNRLNPVTQVEIFNDGKSSNIENRYIGFTFSRVIKDDKIYRILVTVLDETENVLMQRKIQEAEKRNKKESEQLLAILKVNPKVLSEYLDATIQSLEGISVKYESSMGTGFDELLGYTFTIVHSAKGNASLINLKLVEDKLHKVENSIADLKVKEDLEGKNFLRIIYEVTEVVSILKNMKEMLARIADAYNQFSGDKNVEDSNELLISTLKKGISKLSQEKGKEINFVFEENDLVIPDKYKLDIKDMSIQLIRNSIIHGIEEADDRQFLGKPENGTIKIDVKNLDKGQLQFTYEDDGSGIDLDKIVQKAIQKNIISEDLASTMSDMEKAQLIFKDGFSTAEKIDNNAGRGQGMSVIKTIVKKHNGNCKLETVKNKQFKLTVKLP